ncbi:MAG: CarD family transcriptional regulator [Halobacteriovoraceae bacterium]|nr:CarD family transcriptional regulator [Halobacteriovoraceae bacterium]MCB9094029.1 CarD family transcriptional regulator [Halobacteriovoraceae bacterium]
MTKFDIGDYIVYPGHGVGQVLAIEEKNLGSRTLSTYTIKIVSNGMKVIVPSNSEDLRPLVTKTEVVNVFDLLKDHNIKLNRATWNRRHREYMAKINSGSVYEIADVLRSLLLLRFSKKLSFGEKKMVDLCRDLLVKEIALSTGDSESEIGHQIDVIFN